MTSPTRGMLSLGRPLTFIPTLSPWFASGTFLWCISTVKTLPVHAVEAEWVGKNMHSSPGRTAPCSTRPVRTSPTPLILYTPESGTRILPDESRAGGLTQFSRQSRSVSTWILDEPSRSSTSIPFHQPIFSDFLMRLSPIQPEIGMTGQALSMTAFFHPTFLSMWIISSRISVYRASPYPATSQSILLTPTISCFTPRRLMRTECWRVWPCTSPALALPLAMAVVKFPSAGTMIRATSAWEAPVIMFLMKSRWPGASMIV
mmetsp:Transcript_102205/g.142270  ORF Transcript_102205/g.142270 Transcript_102205/m.142270 type:complete len:260 (-) Transcript_102205:217-996(-)